MELSFFASPFSLIYFVGWFGLFVCLFVCLFVFFVVVLVVV